MPELFTLDLIHTLAAVLLLAGFILLAVEVMVPGFGVPGILGILCMIAGIILAADDFKEGLIITLVVLALLGLMCIIILRLMSSGRIKSPIVLKEEQARSEGYLSSNDLQYLLGRQGIAATDLRPSGVGEFDGITFDVISEGTYIVKGSTLEIARVEGSKLVVKQITTK